jgi:uncharacterized CHY-type Zn-finger protein
MMIFVPASDRRESRVSPRVLGPVVDDMTRCVHDRDQEAVLCGACGTELAITSYLATTECPSCRSPFNERCRLHTHLYFET